MLSTAVITIILAFCYEAAYCLSLGYKTALNGDLSSQDPNLILRLFCQLKAASQISWVPLRPSPSPVTALCVEQMCHALDKHPFFIGEHCSL